MLVKAHLKHKSKYFLSGKHFKHSLHVFHDLYDSDNPQLKDKLSLVLGDILRVLNSNLHKDFPQRIDIDILVELEMPVIGVLNEESC